MEEQPAAGFNLKDKKTIIGLVGVVMLLIAIPVAVYLAQQKQIFKPKAAGIVPVSGPETSFRIYSVNDKFVYEPGYYVSEPRILVQVKADIAAANLFVAKLKFPANLLEVTKIDTSNVYQGNTFVTNWVETTYDNNAGTISVVGGVPAPGFQTELGSNPYNMVHIIFKPKGQGVANITFDSESAIYRNSDNVNILEKTSGTTFSIIPNPTVTIYPTSPVSSITPITTPRATATSIPTPTGILGDVNGDGKITLIDMSALLSRWGKTGVEVGKADINGDGVINSVDYSLMINILITNKVIKTSAEAPKP